MDIGDLSVDEFMAKDWGEESSNGENCSEELADHKRIKKNKKKYTERHNQIPLHHGSQTNSTEAKTLQPQQKNATDSHQKQLDALMKKDPEFYKFLQEEDASLLKFNVNDLDLDESSEESESETVHKPPAELEEASDSDLDVASSGDDEGMESSEDTEERHEPKLTKKKKELIVVTEKMLNRWKARLTSDPPSLSALRDLMQAFHASLVRIDAVEIDGQKHGKEKRKKKSSAPSTKYRVNGSATFNSVVGMCVRHVTPALAKVLSYFPEKMKQTKKKKPPLPNSCSRWSAVRDNLRSYLSDVVVLAQSLLEPSVVRVVLRHALLLLPYFVPFPKIAKVLLKHLIKCWSSDDNESVRVLAFLCITRLIKMDKERFLENTMKQTYLGYVANSKFTSPTTLPMINFMQRTFAEICAVDADLTYRFAFLYIRQLAVHLRKAMTTQNKETRQAVYNWQYIHSMGLWCRVLSVLHPNDTLRPLIYPLVQIAFGVIDLMPTARFYPLRFNVVRSLIALSDCTDTYIPLLPAITCPLGLQEFKKKQSGVTVRPIPFETMLKLSNSQLKEKAYRDTTIDHAYDLLMSYFNIQAHTIAFPELCVPTVVMLKKFVKECKTPNYCKVMKQIIDKVQENADFIAAQRSQVTFEFSDFESVQSWETSLRSAGVPFHKHFIQYRKNRQRELVQQIADKNRNVEEKLPSIDRAKFTNMDKAEDREEMRELFGSMKSDEEEEIDADFERAIGEGRSKKRKRDSSICSDVEQTFEKQEPEIAPSPPKKKKLKKVTPRAKIDSDEKDTVKDFSFSDSD